MYLPWKIIRYEPSIIFTEFEKKICLFLQTDDFGVFNTSLTKELQIAACTFNLGSQDLIKLSRIAIESSFASDDEKKLIRDKIDNYLVLQKVDAE